MPTDTLYHMIYPNQYKQYSFDTANTNGWNARTVFHLFTEFDYRVFGQKIIKVTDGRILGGGFEDTVILYRQVQRDGRSNTVMITICTTYGPFWYARTANHKTNDYGGSYNTICDNFWVQDPNDPGPLEVPGSGGSSGSGITQEGHWDTIPPCPEEGGRLHRTNDQPLMCSFIGWQYIWQPDHATYFGDYDNWGYKHFETWDVTTADWAKINNWNYYNIDTTGLDSCRQLILRKLLGSVNGSTPLGRILTKMDRSVKDPNNLEKFNWEFQLQNLGGSVVANTNLTSYDTTTKIFTALTVLDSAIAHDATDIYVAGTFIHEAIHAYLISILKRLRAGTTLAQLHAMTYDSLFNIYVDSLVSKNQTELIALNIDGANHHNYMADHLLSIIANGIKAFDNNSLNDDEYYWYLAWKGLFATKPWRQHWPNYPNTPVTGAPYTTNDSTRGLKYALTPTRIVAINSAIGNERQSNGSARGHVPISGGCY